MDQDDNVAPRSTSQAAPSGLEEIAMNQFIDRLDRSSDSKVVLSRITATYARNRWPMPTKLSEWVAEVMTAAANGKKPFPMPRGRRAPYFQIVLFLSKLKKAGVDLSEAKQRTENHFNVSRQIVNLALRQYWIDPNIVDLI